MKTKTARRQHEKGKILNNEEELIKGIKIWTCYWRKNIHRFIEDYFGCGYLKTFQKIILYLMSYNVHFVFIASRGIGKSMLVAWWCCAYAVLYPAVEIVISAGTFVPSYIEIYNRNRGVSVKPKSILIW